ncbi:uncharacterized protein A1O9_05865 [Exophiala aquamarina CBS 119918]|uniref:Mediator of RNA polymerase II transcription subunit 10 n=1 Tax=Exophiala aquamarina CBS 119918 TaxID=1182545 RepID=A0A072PF97_9EURO|nr:uncharacterized protein A1O9_05865 [Exophiala aquamarina CBS 119918]KEF57943.1 hypothetical protein A1O9_05865 [Exophiala aquamarina CBS 119918]
MAPEKGSKIRGRGASQAIRRPTATGVPPSQFAPPSGQGLSWQTPVVAPARRRSKCATAGPQRLTATSAQTSAEAGENDKKSRHDSLPETASSHWVTLRVPSELLTDFPIHRTKNRWWRDESASEPFVTLQIGHRAAAGIVNTQHSKRNPLPKPLTLQSLPSAQTQASPLPSLNSAATSVLDFAGDLGPRTPSESQPSGFVSHPSGLPQEIGSLKTKPVLQRDLQHPRTAQAQYPGNLVFTAKGAAAPQHLSSEMAPVKDTTGVQAGIKDVIQNLYDIQVQTHGYVPETADLLVDKMTDLAQSLNRLQHMTSTTGSPNNPIHSVRIAPEIVDYVDDGRNPDIFTRDFVENVQRGNAVINGKQKAFKDFSEVFAEVLKEGMPELRRHVDKVMDNAGFGAEGSGEANKPDAMNGPQQHDRNGG